MKPCFLVLRQVSPVLREVQVILAFTRIDLPYLRMRPGRFGSGSVVSLAQMPRPLPVRVRP